MSQLLAESASVDDSVVQQGLHVVGRIVQAYRGFWLTMQCHAILSVKFDVSFVKQVTLLGAMGQLLAESASVDDSVVQQGLHVVGRIVQAYRGLWPKQRGPVHAALNSYLMALTPKQVILQSMLPKFVGILLTYTLKPGEDNLVAGKVHWLL